MGGNGGNWEGPGLWETTVFFLAAVVTFLIGAVLMTGSLIFGVLGEWYHRSFVMSSLHYRCDVVLVRFVRRLGVRFGTCTAVLKQSSS